MSAKPAWRLIDDEPRPGAENMAVDEALLRVFDPERSLPVLRLYRWSPPALSLGRFQKADEALNLERCRTDRVAVVRRITGGGTIYHADELTYSLVCAPHQIPPASSVKDSFRVLTGFLLTFYRRLGLEAAYAVDAAPEGTRLGERTPFCFAGRETFDILINGRKIGGNAQRRTKGIIFQHGSIPLLNRARTGLGYMRDDAPHLAERVTALAECGVSADLPDLGKRLAAAFTDTFGADLCTGALSEQERQAVLGLVPQKYAYAGWNLEGIEQ